MKNCKKAGQLTTQFSGVTLGKKKELCPIIYPNQLSYMATDPIGVGTSLVVCLNWCPKNIPVPRNQRLPGSQYAYGHFGAMMWVGDQNSYF